MGTGRTRQGTSGISLTGSTTPPPAPVSPAARRSLPSASEAVAIAPRAPPFQREVALRTRKGKGRCARFVTVWRGRYARSRLRTASPRLDAARWGGRDLPDWDGFIDSGGQVPY